MAVLEKTITINAPIDKVFNFLIEPENWKEIDHNLTEVKNIQSLPNGGYRCTCKEKVGGFHCETDREFTYEDFGERMLKTYLAKLKAKMET